MTTSPDDEGVDIDVTVSEFKKLATRELEEFGEMFSDPKFRAMLGDELADSMLKINDEKIAQVKEIPDE
jgi:hypothetical protein